MLTHNTYYPTLKNFKSFDLEFFDRDSKPVLFRFRSYDHNGNINVDYPVFVRFTFNGQTFESCHNDFLAMHLSLCWDIALRKLRYKGGVRKFQKDLLSHFSEVS